MIDEKIKNRKRRNKSGTGQVYRGDMMRTQHLLVQKINVILNAA